MLAGCTPQDQPPTPFTGLTKDLRIRWSAEPGIDLLTGPAVIVRAYRESYVVGGLMANPAYYYPGFEHAVPPNAPNVSPLIRPLVAGDPQLESRGFQATTPIIGTWREHILSLSGDPTSGYIAKVCVWDYATGVRQENGKYRYPNRLPPNVSSTSAPADFATLPLRITLTPPSPSEPDPTKTSQGGSSPHPLTDVFGGWKIRTAESLNTAAWMDRVTDWPLDDYRLTLYACAKKIPDPYEKLSSYITGEHPKSDYPTLPADPGWPAAGT
ncbi:hypothetical protein AOT83_03105 [Mycobacteroides sp. H001]|uniref:hypothetical protein n=1 Tax=Mycobacteroides TaxID=670516 RepID=UPI000713B4E9|nr:MULTISPECIES: hypothetical protein [Mycobacteroides]KRQ23902.1 hypothetical protein AOT86_16980 [Mycobacteroides sp. H072]KRQ36839.1 hypothetical protein AOT84_13805 [Mycobacteroides sp. H002]KRQ55231.1 hypothetical protein AOT85_03765 [Mycobacteroides sp. H054]KRQ72908.1 hypothetical protein AOT83_03105 [Mycobacteroides sp. H001]OHU44006.1 hypothetical protein BKG79_04935 [Mycobacteroides chelonae]